MRLIVMFDLPSQTNLDKKNYRDFRKNLKSDGFIMVQYSIYSKLVLNSNIAQNMKNRLKQYIPYSGKVFTLVVTEKQYANMDFISREKLETNTIDTIDRVVIL